MTNVQQKLRKFVFTTFWNVTLAIMTLSCSDPVEEVSKNIFRAPEQIAVASFIPKDLDGRWKSQCERYVSIIARSEDMTYFETSISLENGRYVRTMNSYLKGCDEKPFIVREIYGSIAIKESMGSEKRKLKIDIEIEKIQILEESDLSTSYRKILTDLCGFKKESENSYAIRPVKSSKNQLHGLSYDPACSESRFDHSITNIQKIRTDKIALNASFSEYWLEMQHRFMLTRID